MKAIISHDIDHITVWEHLFKDAIIPKSIARYHIELLTGKISVIEFFSRFGDFFHNKWNNIVELHQYNLSMNIPSSFFIGVRNGLGLSYSKQAAKFWMNKMSELKCEVNIHGIAYSTLEEIKQERDEFFALSELGRAGIRMHYVRMENDTLQNLAQAGYYFDSTEHSFKNPYKVGDMWELPFQIMDGWVIEHGHRWQTKNLEQAIEETKKIIDKSHASNLKYLGIDFHDRYFTKSFSTWIDWYTWITEYLSNNGIEFIDFNSAVKELNKAFSEV